MKLEAKKIELINWITTLDDENILNEINNVFREGVDFWDDLPIEVQEDIEEAIHQSKNGELIDHELFFKKFEK